MTKDEIHQWAWERFCEGCAGAQLNEHVRPCFDAIYLDSARQVEEQKSFDKLQGRGGFTAAGPDALGARTCH